MEQTSKIPTFNMKAVVQETGVKPDTLRAWERRYNLPQPERTSGGHRLYSERDIEIVKWLLQRQEEGLSISNAVDMWRRLVDEGQDPILVRITSPVAKTMEVPLAADGTEAESLTKLRLAWVKSCLAFDESSANQVLTEAFGLYPPELVCIELLQKGLSDIGMGWYEGTVSVQQEHFASELAIRRLESLVNATPEASRPGRILVCCPAGEDHTFGPLLITLLLRRRGWDVLYLGANVPVDRLESMLDAVKPDLIVFSAQLIETAATLRDTAVKLMSREIPIAFGGRIFNILPDLRQRIPGYFLGEDIADVPATIERLLTRYLPALTTRPVDATYEQASSYFRRQRVKLEARLEEVAVSTGLTPDDISFAGTNLTNKIEAALSLGDINFLDADIDWLSGLLGNRNQGDDAFGHFAKAYLKAAEEVLDQRGEVVADWLRPKAAS